MDSMLSYPILCTGLCSSSRLLLLPASLSLISASFSVIKQSVLLDYFPRVTIIHTSKSKEGEVYSPEVNYILMILCVAVVLGFEDSSALGNAFGLVVIFVMLITTILLTTVMIVVWRTPLFFALLYFIPFFALEGVYVSSVLVKFVHGGWLPFAISTILATVMFSWYYGRQKKLEYEIRHKITVEELGNLLYQSSNQSVPGLSFFYTGIQDGVTPILAHYLNNLRSVHKVIVFTTLKYTPVPKVEPRERIAVRRIGPRGFYGCLVCYGYADSINPDSEDFATLVTEALKCYIRGCGDNASIWEEVSKLEEAKAAGVVHVDGKARFCMSKETSWTDRVFLRIYEFLHKNCRPALPALDIPVQKRVEIGMLYSV